MHKILIERLPRTEAIKWTEDSFELADFAILPEFQGKGIGRKIYDSFYSGVSESRATLKTHAADSVATQMYERRGFVRLLDPFIWGPKNLPYTAMGRLMKG